MRVKIFQGVGKDQIQRLERDINDWLRSDSSISVDHTNTSAASVSEAGGSNETHQAFIVSVWYENSN
jgi:hypothetical protein